MPLITIAAVTIPDWQGNTSGVSLRIYTNENFIAQSGTIYPKSVLANPASLGTFFQSVVCTISGADLTIPEVQIDSTTDSPDRPDATYSAVFWDDDAEQPIQTFGICKKFSVAASPTSTTWAAVFTSGCTCSGSGGSGGSGGTGGSGSGSGFGPPLAIPAPNGGTTYTLPISPTTPAASFYFVNGSKMIYGSYYTISGSTLTIIGSQPPPPNSALGDTHELYAY
jgi:hypothetical protein